jgi:hypothetical protein
MESYLQYTLIIALFARLISHQPTVLLSQNKPAISNQPAVVFSQNKPAPAISHQPNEQAAPSYPDPSDLSLSPGAIFFVAACCS